MYDGLTVHFVIAIDDLVHDGNGFCFGYVFLVGDEFSEISSFTKFGDDVSVVFGSVDVIKFDDVLATLHHFEHLYFRGQQITVDFVADFLHFDHFYGYCLIWVIFEIPVTSFLPRNTTLE